MKIHSKPKASKRKKRDYDIYASCMTLAEIRTQCQHLLTRSYQYTEEEAAKLDYSDIAIESRWDYDSESIYAVFTLPISDHEFDIAQKKYAAKLKAYNKWYAENEAEILADLKRREQEKHQAEAAAVQKEVDKLSARLAKNQKKLEALLGEDI